MIEGDRTDRIELRRVRNVAEIINDTFALVRRHRRFFVRTLMTIAFAPMLVATAVGGFFFFRAWLPLLDPYNVQSGQESFVGFLLVVGLTIPLALIGYAMLILVLHELLRMHESLSDEEMAAASVRDVWIEVKGRILPMIGTMLTWGLALLFLMLIPFIGSFLLPVVFIYTLLYFPLRIYDRRGLLQSFVVSAQLISGSWWKTTGLVLTFYLLTLVLTGIFVFPMMLYSMLGAVGLWDLRDLGDDPTIMGILGFVYLLLYGTASFFTTGLSLIAVILHYHSRAERKEARSIEQRIPLIGAHLEAPASSPGHSEDFNPVG